MESQNNLMHLNVQPLNVQPLNLHQLFDQNKQHLDDDDQVRNQNYRNQYVDINNIPPPSPLQRHTVEHCVDTNNIPPPSPLRRHIVEQII
jgi:hypothetical protein